MALRAMTGAETQRLGPPFLSGREILVPARERANMAGVDFGPRGFYM